MSPETKAKRAARQRAYRHDPEMGPRINEAHRANRKKRMEEIRSGKRPSPECLSVEYTTWMGIIQRCYNPKNCNYRYYGARGISVCDRWLASYRNFLSDMGRKPSPDLQLDRIDNAMGYGPSNCRWVTSVVNNRNTRSVRFVEWEGKKWTLPDLCDSLGLDRSMVRHRLGYGWSIDEAISVPKGKYIRRSQ